MEQMNDEKYLEAAKKFKVPELLNERIKDIKWDLFWHSMPCVAVNNMMNSRTRKIIGYGMKLISIGYTKNEVASWASTAMDRWVHSPFSEHGAYDSEPRWQKITILNRWINHEWN